MIAAPTTRLFVGMPTTAPAATATYGAPQNGQPAASSMAPAVAAPPALPAPVPQPAPLALLTPTAAPMPATAVQAAQTGLTTLAPGALASDGMLVERALGVLRTSPDGAALVDRLLAVGARINVISDEEFAAMGHDRAHAFYDPNSDAMFLRRSDLADDANVGFAAVALAHEGTHLLDDVGKVADPFISDISGRIAQAGGTGTPQGAAIRDQALFELRMIKETRAFTFAGQIARQLGVESPAGDPTRTAAAGANDGATYAAVWNELLGSTYNPEGRRAVPLTF